MAASIAVGTVDEVDQSIWGSKWFGGCSGVCIDDLGEEAEGEGGGEVHSEFGGWIIEVRVLQKVSKSTEEIHGDDQKARRCENMPRQRKSSSLSRSYPFAYLLPRKYYPTATIDRYPIELKARDQVCQYVQAVRYCIASKTPKADEGTGIKVLHKATRVLESQT